MNIEKPITQQTIDELAELELADKIASQKVVFELFYQNREGSDPHSSVVEAIKLVKNKDRALEIGPGTYEEVKYMIEQGFDVMAIGPDDTSEYTKDINKNKLTSIQGNIVNYEFSENSFDFINASLIFPFIKKQQWSEVLDGIKKSLKDDGIFTGIFFGEKSVMVVEQDNYSTNIDELKSFFENGFEIKKLEEIGPKPSSKGLYHNIIIIVQKK